MEPIRRLRGVLIVTVVVGGSRCSGTSDVTFGPSAPSDAEADEGGQGGAAHSGFRAGQSGGRRENDDSSVNSSGFGAIGGDSARAPGNAVRDAADTRLLDGGIGEAGGIFDTHASGHSGAGGTPGNGGQGNTGRGGGNLTPGRGGAAGEVLDASSGAGARSGGGRQGNGTDATDGSHQDPKGSGGSPVVNPPGPGEGGNAGVRVDTDTGAVDLPDSGPNPAPDAAPGRDPSSVLCSFDYPEADAGYGRPICNMEPGNAGPGGRLSPSTEDAEREAGGPGAGSLQFTTSFDASRQVRIRSGSETLNWAGKATLSAKIKVLTAGSLRTVALGVAAQDSTSRSLGRAYDFRQSTVGKWTEITYDLSRRDATVSISDIRRIVLQFAASPAGQATTPTNATVLIDDVRVE